MPRPAALVTGASSGIGRAIALALARDGSPVAVNYNSRADKAAETLGLIEDAGGKGLCVQADVGDPGAVDRCFAEVEEALGRVGILVNNAGARADTLALSMTDDQWDLVVRTNLSGSFHCSRRALKPMMRLRWGRIVNISSVSALNGNPGQANYSAAKAGLIGMTQTLAKEMARANITVNAVAPGLVLTDFTTGMSEEQLAGVEAGIPMRRPGTPDEVAGLVSYLCSDAAGYITGTVIAVDGGMTA